MSFTQKLKLILSGLWKFIEPFVKMFLSNIGQIAFEEAMRLIPVIASSMSGASGTDKRDAVIAQIKINLASKGIEIGTTMLLNMVQAAYTKLKEDRLIE